MLIGFSQLLIFGFTYLCWPRLPILYNRIIRSEKWKQWIKYKATVEGAPVCGEEPVCTLCYEPTGPGLSEGGDTQPQTVSLSAHHQLAATRPSSRHPRQLFSLPVLWDRNRCWTLVHLLREFWPATAAPNQEATGTSPISPDGQWRGVGWGCLRVRGESSGRWLVLPPGAPGHRNQGGYPPGVVGTSHLFWLTLLA